MSISNRVILQFVNSNAELALQDNLQLPEQLANKVVQTLTPEQMVMLNQNLPQFKQFFIELVNIYGHFDKNHYLHYRNTYCDEPCEKLWLDYPVTDAFNKLYDEVLEPQIKDHIDTLAYSLHSLKEKLNMDISSGFDVISSLKGNFADVAKFTATAKSVAISETAKNTEKTADQLSASAFELLNPQYPAIPAAIQAQLLTPKLLGELTAAHIALTNKMGLPLEARIHFMEITKSYYMDIVPSLASVIMNFINRRGIAYVSHLPNVFQYELFWQNPDDAEAHDVWHRLTGGGWDLLEMFDALMTPQFFQSHEPSMLPDAITPTNVVLATALLLMAGVSVRSMYRAYQYWTKPAVQSADEESLITTTTQTRRYPGFLESWGLGSKPVTAVVSSAERRANYYKM